MLYNNIRGIHANLNDLIVSSRQFDILFCSETLVSNLRSPKELLIPGFKQPHLLKRNDRRRGQGMAAYIRKGFPASRKPNYECDCHEVLVLKVCGKHTDWLKATHTDVGGIEAFHFSISNELEQIIKHPTRVPDRHDHAANPLDLFFTSNPQNYTYTVSSPLGSSDHCTVSVTSTFTPPPPIPPTQRHLWHFENARRADMSNFLFDFPWDDYCFRTRDPDLAATAVGEVMDSGMRAYIPYSLITFSPSKPWFDRACSSAISDREGAHRSYQASPSELTHATFISARNRCSAKLRRARSSFRKRKIDKLNSSPTEKCFWSLSKKIFNNFCNSNFPSLIRPDGSIACSPTDKANLFGSYFSANSSLNDSNAPDPPT